VHQITRHQVAAACNAAVVREILEPLVGPIDHVVSVDRGYTHNERVVAFLQGGGSVFAKKAVDPMTAEWLRQEFEI